MYYYFAQGMIVSNTTNARPSFLKDTEGVKGEAGGLSGLPVRDMSTEVPTPKCLLPSRHGRESVLVHKELL
jgi:hypothetical protein